jgi:hypothetical protein
MMENVIEWRDDRGCFVRVVIGGLFGCDSLCDGLGGGRRKKKQRVVAVLFFSFFCFFFLIFFGLFVVSFLWIRILIFFPSLCVKTMSYIAIELGFRN